MLRQLVPMDLIKAYAPEDWKKVIGSSYNRHTIRSQDDAKIGFLKYVGRWATFGSAFFEVKVSSLHKSRERDRQTKEYRRVVFFYQSQCEF